MPFDAADAFVELADQDEQAKIGDLLEKPAQGVDGKRPLREIEMGLQAHAVQRDAGGFQPFEQLEEVVAPVVFETLLVLEPELIDDQAGLGRQLACLP